MQQEISELYAAINSGNPPTLPHAFSRFCSKFKDEMLVETKTGLFGKLFSKSSPFDQGIELLNQCLQKDIYLNLPWTTFMQSFTLLFQILLHPDLKLQQHKIAFTFFLKLLISIQADCDTKELKPLGDLLVYGLALKPYLKEPEKLYKIKLPEYKVDQTKPKTLTQELYQKLMETINENIEYFQFWWTLLCESLFPSVFGSITAPFSFAERPFDLDRIAEFIIDDRVSHSQISCKYPWFIYHIIADTSSDNQKVYKFFRHYYEYYENILISAASASSYAVSDFYNRVITVLGKQLTNKAEFPQARNYFNNIIIKWGSFAQLHEETAYTILAFLANSVRENPNPYTLYVLLVMSYLAGTAIPAEIASVISGMNEALLSVACSFSCVLSVAFISQQLKISDLAVFNDDSVFADCGAFFLKHSDSPLILRRALTSITRSIVSNVLVTRDSRSPLEGETFIDMFFKGWSETSGVHTMYSCFIMTSLNIINVLPSSYKINVSEIFSKTLKSFLDVALEASEPSDVLDSVDVIISIIRTRGFSESLTPRISALVSLTLIKLISMNNSGCISTAPSLIAESILTGNSVFMCLTPYLVFCLQNSDKVPTDVIRALDSACIFFYLHKDIKKPIMSLESKAMSLLGMNRKILNNSAIQYFVSQKKIDNVSSAILDLLINFLRNGGSNKELELAFVRITHQLLSNKIKLPAQIDEAFGSLIPFTPNLVDGLYCMTDVVDDLKKNEMRFYKQLLNSLNLPDPKTETNTVPLSSILTSIDICIAAGDWGFIRDILKQQQDDVLTNILLVHLYGRGALSNPTVCDSDLIGFAAHNVVQEFTGEADGSEVITWRVNERFRHELRMLNFKEDNTITETKSGDKTNAVAPIDAEFTSRMFGRLKDSILENKKHFLLVGPSGAEEVRIDKEEAKSDTEDVKSDTDENLPHREVIRPEKDKRNGALAAATSLGMMSASGHELRTKSEKIKTELTRTCAMPQQARAVIPVHYAKSGQIIDNWSETSLSFQRFAHSLGASKDGKAIISNWRTDAEFVLTALAGQRKDASRIRVVWSDGIESVNDGIQGSIVIQLAPLRTGAVRICVPHVRSAAPLTGEHIVSSRSLPSMLTATVCALCGKNTEGDNVYSRYLRCSEIIGEEYCEYSIL